MANPTISLLGATYSDVAGVTLPTSGGGTATFPFVEGSQTITANGTVDVTSLAEVIVNVAGGGGGGLEYEEGTWSPSSDIARGTITFANSHTVPPTLILLADATGTSDTTTNSVYMFAFVDYYRLTGHGIPYSASAYRYANALYGYRSTSTSSISFTSLACTYNSDNSTSSSTSYSRYWATATNFHPYSNSTSRYWRAGSTFKWIAVWT